MRFHFISIVLYSTACFSLSFKRCHLNVQRKHIISSRCTSFRCLSVDDDVITPANYTITAAKANPDVISGGRTLDSTSSNQTRAIAKKTSNDDTALTISTVFGAGLTGLAVAGALDLSVADGESLMLALPAGFLALGGGAYYFTSSQPSNPAVSMAKQYLGTPVLASQRKIRKKISETVEETTESILSIPSNVKTAATSAIDNAVKDVKSTVNAVPGKVQAAAGKVADEVAAIPGKLVAAAGQAVDKAVIAINKKIQVEILLAS